jgi:hypothetical protein
MEEKVDNFWFGLLLRTKVYMFLMIITWRTSRNNPFLLASAELCRSSADGQPSTILPRMLLRSFNINNYPSFTKSLFLLSQHRPALIFFGERYLSVRGVIKEYTLVDVRPLTHPAVCPPPSASHQPATMASSKLPPAFEISFMMMLAFKG